MRDYLQNYILQAMNQLATFVCFFSLSKISEVKEVHLGHLVVLVDAEKDLSLEALVLTHQTFNLDLA